MNKLTKMLFSLLRPRVVLAFGSENALEYIFKVLKSDFKVKRVSERLPLCFGKKEIFVFIKEPVFDDLTEFLVGKSRLPILVLMNSENMRVVQKLAKKWPKKGYLIFNADDEALNRIRPEIKAASLSLGFKARADFQASDVTFNGGINFKIGHKGNIVPFWLEKPFPKERVYNVLAGVCLGIIFGLNLVEISQILKS